mmetsp:Transcript_17246/g.26905  ORF Transcript_17246/g.26905 Transcript_17246/m.26905 type:complete len:892 (+) Transcript_17246:30-2705(+)
MQYNDAGRVLQELETEYRKLASESKKTDSHLTNATDKAIAKLIEYRSMHKTLAELRDILASDLITVRPLLLSWSGKSVSLSLKALHILQRLLNLNCISSDCFMQILISLRTLLTLHTNYKSSSFATSSSSTSSSSSSSSSLSSSAYQQQSTLDINIQIKVCQNLIQIPNSSAWTISKPFLQHIVYITLLLCQSEENAVRSTSLAALQQIATVALEYCVQTLTHNNNVNNNNNNNNAVEDDDVSMYFYESLFHDLCCLASPQSLYLQKTKNIMMMTATKDNNASVAAAAAAASAVLSNQSAVSVSMSPQSMQMQIDHNNNHHQHDISHNMDISVDPAPSQPNHSHLVTHLAQNHKLGSLRLLDVDFRLDYVPILELIETLIANSDFTLGLKHSAGLVHVLHHQLCPLLCEMIGACNTHNNNNESMSMSSMSSISSITLTSTSFEGMMRVARVIIELLSRHYAYLDCETELLLSELLRLLEPSLAYPEWAPLIILEILRHLLRNSQLLKFFFIKYDMNHSSDKHLHQTTSMKNKSALRWSPKRMDHKFFSFVKDPRHPPTDAGALHVSLAVLSLISFVEGLAVVCNVSASSPITSPLTSPVAKQKATMYPPPPDDDSLSMDAMDNDIALDVSLDIAQRMVEVLWRPLLAALSHMLSQSAQETQYQQLLSIYQTMSRICGRIQLIKPLERLLSSMIEHGLPHPFFNYTFSDILYKLSSSDSSLFSAHSGNTSAAAMVGVVPGVGATASEITSQLEKTAQSYANAVGGISLVEQSDLSGGSHATTIQLSIRNVCTIHALVNIAHGLGAILGSAWSVLLETFEKLDYIFHRQNIQLVDVDQNIISPDSHWNDEVNMLDSRLHMRIEIGVRADCNWSNLCLSCLPCCCRFMTRTLRS